MKRIVVFGAAFDPPHLGHEELAKQMILRNLADEVWWMPCREHPFAKVMSKSVHRLAMTELVVARLNDEIPGDYFYVSDIEIQRLGASYAIETLEEVARQNPDAEVQWLMGADQLKDFHKWHRHEEILQRFGMLVYPRPGYEMQPWLPGMTSVEGVPMRESASSLIRREIEHGGVDKGFDLAEDVRDYIQQQHVYEKES